MATITMVASVLSPPDVRASPVPQAASWVEIRTDLTGEIDPDWGHDYFDRPLLYSFRRSYSGNRGFEANDVARRRKLLSFSRNTDFIELELADLDDSLLSEIPIEKRVISWYGQDGSPEVLAEAFRKMSSVPARLYKLVNKPQNIFEEISALRFLRSLDRDDTIIYSNGPSGYWSRLFSARFGAPFVFGALSEYMEDTSEPSIIRLVRDYGLPNLPDFDGIFAIVGDPVSHSLSPRLHNSAYRSLGIPSLFLPLRVGSLTEFCNDIIGQKQFEMLGISMRGMTVASPNKEAALAITTNISSLAAQAESANLLVNKADLWCADTTDPEVISLAKDRFNTRLARKRAAVIGCGGAGRAIAQALKNSDAQVTLFNRGINRGRYAEGLLGLKCFSLNDFRASDFEIVVNATPVGRDGSSLPFSFDNITDDALVIDLVYGSAPTPLVAGSLDRGVNVIDGYDVLIAQVTRQFHLMTGYFMPPGLPEIVLGPRPTEHGFGIDVRGQQSVFSAGMD